MFARFGPQTRRVIDLAEDHARALWRPAVGPDHLLLALLAVDDTGAFAGAGLRFDDVRGLLLEWSAGDPGGRTNGAGPGRLPMQLREVFRQAFRHMVLTGADEVTPLHLALALVDEPPPAEVAVVLRRLEVSIDDVRESLRARLMDDRESELVAAGPTVVPMAGHRVIDLRDSGPEVVPLRVSASSGP